jgi:hypothetical protein
MNDFNEIPLDQLKSVLRYEPWTGLLFWLPRPIRASTDKTWNERFADQVAGSTRSDGYIIVTIFNKSFLAHRLCWALHYGEWPQQLIEQRDGDRANNRIANLRKADNSQIFFNRGANRTNKLGIKGVYYNEKNRAFYATICVYGKRHHLGTFETAEAAKAARVEAEARLQGEFRHKPTS